MKNSNTKIRSDRWELYDASLFQDMLSSPSSSQSNNEHLHTSRTLTFSNYFRNEEGSFSDDSSVSARPFVTDTYDIDFPLYDDVDDDSILSDLVPAKSKSLKDFYMDDTYIQDNYSVSDHLSMDDIYDADVSLDDGDQDDDSSLWCALAPARSKSFKDFYKNPDDQADRKPTKLLQPYKDTHSAPSSSIQKLSNDTYTQTPDNPSSDILETTISVSEIPPKRNNSKKLTLQDMQVEITNIVDIILHNGGIYYYNGRTYQAIGDSYDLLSLIRARISPTAFASIGIKQFFDLLVYMKADSQLIPADYHRRLQRSKNLVVMNNGVLDLNTLTLLPHNKYYLTFHEFDAEYVDKKPKVFIRFLEQVSGGDPEIMQRIVEAMGYIFSGMNRRIFFVAGTAHGSGKSTLGILLQSLIGDQYVSNISTHQLDGRFALGGTRQSILNLCMDIPKGHLSSVVVSIIKSVSGGDTISCEQKYQAPERMISNIRFLFGSNYGISVPESENEDAFWSRMVVLPFPFTIPAHQVDPTIVEKMIDEKDRIISYCLRAMSHVLTNNCTFSPCQVADEMKRNWRHLSADSKSFELYWYENITVTGKSDDQIFTHELYNDYLQFCAERNLEAIPLNSIKPWVASNIPQNECSHKRLHKTNDNPKSGFIGVKFKNINEKGITNYDT